MTYRFTFWLLDSPRGNSSRRAWRALLTDGDGTTGRKGTELANHCGDLATLATSLRHGMARVRRRRDLAFAFIRRTGLEW